MKILLLTQEQNSIADLLSVTTGENFIKTAKTFSRNSPSSGFTMTPPAREAWLRSSFRHRPVTGGLPAATIFWAIENFDAGLTQEGLHH